MRNCIQVVKAYTHSSAMQYMKTIAETAVLLVALLVSFALIIDLSVAERPSINMIIVLPFVLVVTVYFSVKLNSRLKNSRYP